MTATSSTTHRPPVTTLGISAGNGMIHCALVTVDEHDRLVVDARVIDVDRTDRLDRAGRVNSGIDLMLGGAAVDDLSVAAIGVASRSSDTGPIASRGVGPRRQIHLLGDAESVAQALVHSGEVASHREVVVVDCGDSGMTISRLTTATGKPEAAVRVTAMSGSGIDAELARIVDGELAQVGDTDLSSPRSSRASLRSACRTAKEELSVSDSTSVSHRARTAALTVATLDEVVVPAARAAVSAVRDFIAAQSMSSTVPVVLVGGVANIPAVQQVFAESFTAAVITPDGPELMGAVGAALLARPNRSSALRLAFIGGRRHRDWWSGVPLAVAGSFLALAVLAVFAFSAALAGSSTPVDGVDDGGVAPASSTTLTSTRPGTTAPGATTRTPAATPPVTTATAQIPVAGDGSDGALPTTTTAPTLPYPNDGYDQRRARPWATTELPTSPQAQEPTSTITVPPPASGTPPSGTSPSGTSPTSPELSSPIPGVELTPFPLLPAPALPIAPATPAPLPVAP